VGYEMVRHTGNHWSHWNIVTKGTREYLENVPGKQPIDSVQKTAALGTSHLIRKVLQCET